MDGTFEDPLLRELEADLSAPFPVDRVKWRVGRTTKDKSKATALAYIDARDVYERFDNVLGLAGWQCRHEDGGDGRLSCSIGIRLENEWIWKSDGAGSRQASGGLSEQDANKGDYSDALKRAAVAWGVGRYLYDLTSPWVAIDQYKKIEKAEEENLRKILIAASGEIGMQTPSERATIGVILSTIRHFCHDRADCEEFYRENRGMLAKLRKAQMEEVTKTFAAISNNTAQEAAE
jgi:hypothetical protein